MYSIYNRRLLHRFLKISFETVVAYLDLPWFIMLYSIAIKHLEEIS